MASPTITVAIPIHQGMKNFNFFFDRCVSSVEHQSFRDFEIVITEEGKMAHNTNAAIQRSKGKLIKLLYMDDYLAHPHALQEIVDSFSEEHQWLATGCLHQSTETTDFYEDPHSPHYARYTDDIHTGNNGIGSPSVVTMRNEGHLLFDEHLSFLLDCDLYKRYYATYGAPKILNDLNVVIGIHDGQTSNLMPTAEKQAEFNYVMNKYEN